MSNVLDKSFIHRSYPKLAYGSMNDVTKFNPNFSSSNIHPTKIAIIFSL